MLTMDEDWGKENEEKEEKRWSLEQKTPGDGSSKYSSTYRVWIPHGVTNRNREPRNSRAMNKSPYTVLDPAKGRSWVRKCAGKCVQTSGKCR